MDLKTAQGLGMQAIRRRKDVAKLLPPGTGLPGRLWFAKEAVMERAGSHVLVPVANIAIADIVGDRRCAALAKLLRYHGMWWYDEPSLRDISREPMKARWMLVSRDPVLYTHVSREQCEYAEQSAPYEPRLGIRETLYALLVCHYFGMGLRLPDRDYVVVGFDDSYRPDPYTVWNTGHGYLLNTFGPGKPLSMPYYGLTEYVEVGALYEEPGC